MLIVPTVFTTVLTMPFSILFVVASVRMRKLESYHFSLGVAVLACVPCMPVWLVGLPMGLWAISVLLRPEVEGGVRPAGSVTSLRTPSNCGQRRL